MAYRSPSRPFPAFPTITADTPVSEAFAQEVRVAVSASGRLGAYNLAKPEGRKTQWGSQVRLRVGGVSLSQTPFEGHPEAETWCPDLNRHVLLLPDPGEKDGEPVGLMICPPSTPEMNCSGILAADAQGRGWFFNDATPDAPEPVSLAVPAAVQEFVLGGKPLTHFLPACGRFCIKYQNIYAVHGGLVPVPAVPASLDPVLAREQSILDAVAPVITEEAFGKILDTLTYPTKDGVFPGHSTPERKAFDDALEDFARQALIRVRDAGLCEPCPNNGPRGVTPMKLWDVFLTGKADAEETDASWDEMRAYHWAMMMPAFRIFQTALIEVGMDAENAIWAERNGGGKRVYGPNGYEDVPFSREEAKKVFPAFRDAVLTRLCEEAEAPGREAELRGDLDETYFALCDSVFKPVLCDRMDPRKTPLPVLETPKPLRHTVLTLPSGRLAMADWFRVPGFTEAIEALSEEPAGGFEINHAKGMDARAEAYIKKAGVAIVQVGNSSPSAYADGEGVWRMGHVDEEHEAFWVGETDERSAVQMPEEVWDTCTDLWANTFASPEAIVKVMMSSGEYADAAEAEATLAKYCEETYGAHIVDLGTTTLHVYAYTGAARRNEDGFPKIGGEVLSQDPWWRDTYILSATELSVDPALIEEEVWAGPELPVPDEDLRP